MFFSYDTKTASVVVGPAKLNKSPPGGPGLLEFGGVVRRPRHFRRTMTTQITVKPRPFMRPAFKVTKDELAGHWRDQIR